MSKYVNQFIIENDNVIEIKEEIILKGQYIFELCRGSVSNVDNLKEKLDPFYYYYLKDEKKIGFCGIRESEKSVKEIKEGLKLDDKSYYLDARNGLIYYYKYNSLIPFVIYEKGRKCIVSVGFKNE